MKAQIKTLSSNNYEVTWEIEVELIQDLPTFEGNLAGAGYLPTGEAPRSPEGLPICSRHGEVMRSREKQGDEWFSHSVIDPTTGERVYCKGRPGKDSPGWYTTDARKPEAPKASGSNGGGQGGGQAKRSPAPATSAQPEGEKEPQAEVKAGGKKHQDPVTAYWDLASQLITSGQVTVEKAGEIAKAEGTWAEKAARLHL
jgi:hypothetical protein